MNQEISPPNQVIEFNPETINPETESFFSLKQEQQDLLLNNLIERLRDPNTNIVIGTSIAGAGHLRQAERVLRFLRWCAEKYEIKDLESRITFVVIDKTKEEIKSFSDLGFRLYPIFQRGGFGLMKIIQFFLNRSFVSRQIDVNVDQMGKQALGRVEQYLRDSTFEGKKTFDPGRPTIWISTHSLFASAVNHLLLTDERKHDLVLEFVPDPWKGADLKSMTVSNPNTSNWITVVHDEETAKEYRKLRPNSTATVLSWGTISHWIYHLRREKLIKGEIQPRQKMDIFIECSGSYIPKFDKKIVEFIRANKERIKNGEIRIVIDPMHHLATYNTFKKLLEELGLLNCPNILLLAAAADIKTAVKRREDILEGKNADVENHFKEQIPFNPFAVIAKGGEVPLEDRADMVVLCPIASVPHEVRDIQAGVGAGRAIDARDIPPSNWFARLNDEFIKINQLLQQLLEIKKAEDRQKKIEQALPRESWALLAIGLLGINNLLEN